MVRSRRINLIQSVYGLLLLGMLSGCPGAGDSASAVLPAITDAPNICIIPGASNQLVDEVVARINQIRVERGLSALTVNEELTLAAEDYACQHIEHNFYELLGGRSGEGLSHEHPITGEGPGGRAIQAGYLFVTLGENLAGGQTTAASVVADWMDSPGHRDNILDPRWRDMGVGVRTGGHFGVYWVQMFGDPP
jgi:uncharacterized protein YkwD